MLLQPIINKSIITKLMHNRDMVQLVVFGTSAVALFTLYHNYQKFNQMLRDLLTTDIQRYKEIQQNKNKNNGDIVLLKDQLKHPGKQERSQFDIGSNMLLYNQIPLRKYRVQHYYQMMLRQSWRKVKLREYPLGIFIPELAVNKLIQTTGYSYTSIFDSKDKPGFFGTIFKYTFATIAAIATFFLKVFINNRNGQPVISGPTWGKLTLVSQLITDKPLVLLCKVDGNRLVPLFAGLNKKDIAEWLQNEKQSYMLSMIIALFCLYKSKSIFTKIVREIRQTLAAQNFSLKFKGVHKRRKQYDAKVADEQACIICYNNCRNLIIRKCKHLIMCSRCVKQNSIDSCPMCRVSTDGDFIKVMPCEE